MEGRMWQDVGRLIEVIDYTNENGAIQFSKAIVQFIDSCTYEELAKKIDPLVCIDRRRYSIGERTLPPLGYYEPSEAMVLAISNVSRGRLLKRATNPSYMYDYDENGHILCISQMHTYEHLKGKPANISYCLHEGKNEYYMTFRCSYGNSLELSTRPTRTLGHVVVVLQERDEGIKYIWRASSSLNRKLVFLEIEVYGQISNGLQSIDRHTITADLENQKSSIITRRGQISYDYSGTMSACLFDE